MLVIVDYGAGNVASIRNMVRKAGFDSQISSDPAKILSASKLILPGVGHFDHGMQNLRERGLVEALNTRVLEQRVPILGICLGIQLFARRSDEGAAPGLGWLAADVVRFDVAQLGERLRVPHMGWSDVEIVRPHPIFEGLPRPSRFYFVHSYHLQCDTEELVTTRAYHGYSFTASVAQANILGVQFHPEKSHTFGLQVLRNFAGFARP
jgi:glutamine amidotransferase